MRNMNNFTSPKKRKSIRGLAAFKGNKLEKRTGLFFVGRLKVNMGTLSCVVHGA